ncbi:hypothetical protein BOTNAR_0031g00410 [Botryotinia narcissicola]|uniref:Uncharacterized protein n=1 Tax=Botryotinia narcissicola TaxID=278944 RepID=A0A4Z1J997_9HELO|nr:hypothetical protein BOTNAR_0031g00410 [Botryotinia narcissicola]
MIHPNTIEQIIQPTPRISQTISAFFAERQGTAVAEKDRGRRTYHAGFGDGSVRKTIHVGVVIVRFVAGIGSRDGRGSGGSRKQHGGVGGRGNVAAEPAGFAPGEFVVAEHGVHSAVEDGVYVAV